MTRRRYWIRDEPADDVYDGLLRHGADECSAVSLIVQPQLALSVEGGKLLKDLGGFVETKTEVSEWPGTKRLNDHPVTEYRLSASPEVVAALLHATNRLYEWRQPALPEDLAMFRDDGSVWLATIAHERESFMELTPDEASALGCEVPGLLLDAE